MRRGQLGRTALLVLLHLAALAILIVTESAVVPKLAFLLSWGFFNFCWIALLRRPTVAAAISLAWLVLLILVSRFKHDVLLMTVNFIDLMIIDRDTVSFVLRVFPSLDVKAAVAGALLILTLILAWYLEPFRIRRRMAAAAGSVCLVGLVGLALAFPSDPWEEFYGENYFSKFTRSGVTAMGDLITRGVLESDAAVTEQLAAAAAAPCTVGKPPHIVMVFDESSFDIRAVPGVKVPAGYGAHFKSDDGAQRSLMVEGAGGPSWFTEYNVLTGLSARSYGRFADFVTRIAAGRVERGLPHTLRKCGYKTFTLYPMYGAFLSARHFQASAGIQQFLDSEALGANFLDPDSFYFDKAAATIAKERGKAPLFLLVYTAQNHFPWTFRFRPDLAPEWRDPGNRADVDEYLRRQHLSAVDYRAFVARLKNEFPDERFLLVRFGDHQPYFARNLIDPDQDDSMLRRRIAAADPRFLMTYYAVNAINFTPRDLSSAVNALDAPYLPLVVLEAAGIPLDPSFAEQKKILQRCAGLFYRCNGGAEARRFNRLLIDAGLIKGL
ncbi:MAG: LTA synthase family protein [Alphaproteobacteria bacterium]|nr:MAG: LTA synthase family protein [Alphaproteobacteria bacterium]